MSFVTECDGQETFRIFDILDISESECVIYNIIAKSLNGLQLSSLVIHTRKKTHTYKCILYTWSSNIGYYLFIH